MRLPGIRISVEMLIFFIYFFGFDTTLKRVLTQSEEVGSVMKASSHKVDTNVKVAAHSRPH